jgi:hypothetical protein
MLVTVLFSNRIEIKECKYDLTFWRKVFEYAKTYSLKIKRLTIGSRIVDKNADWYFVINQATHFAVKNSTIWERGVGSVRMKEPKTRIEWYDMQTNILNNVKLEPGIIGSLEEFGIEREK